MIVSLDTNILVWGIRGKALPQYSDKVARAKALLRRLEEEKVTIIVPAPVIFEFLLDVHPEMYGVTIKLLNQRFRIMPYDLAAARKNAEIWMKKNNGRKVHPDIRSQWPDTTKAELRFDCQIVAISAHHKAKILFSEDGGVSAFADGVIDVQPVPEAVDQLKFDI